MTIKNYKTITIAASTPSNTFSIPIFLQFIPSHFIIKFISHFITSSAAVNDHVLLLKTSLLNNDTILSIARTGGANLIECVEHTADIKFKMNPSTINGNYDFNLCNITGNSPDFFTAMQIALIIEFIEEI